jgi:hypothetical protein
MVNDSLDTCDGGILCLDICHTGVSTATGNPQNVLWGLWISIFWLNITVFVLAIGANNQLTAIYWALRGTKDESTFSLKVNKWVKEQHDKDNEKI